MQIPVRDLDRVRKLPDRDAGGEDGGGEFPGVAAAAAGDYHVVGEAVAGLDLGETGRMYLHDLFGSSVRYILPSVFDTSIVSDSRPFRRRGKHCASWTACVPYANQVFRPEVMALPRAVTGMGRRALDERECHCRPGQTANMYWSDCELVMNECRTRS